LPNEALLVRLARVIESEDVVSVVAADSGIGLADAIGVTVDQLVGDMDSVDPERLARAATDGVSVVRFPVHKDATDAELALDVATARGRPGDRVVVLGSTAGRFDHVLALLGSLAGPNYEQFERDAWLGGDVVHVVAEGRRRLPMPAGTTFSMLPLHGAAVVSVTGVRWALHQEPLAVGTSRGVSNVATASEVVVDVADGVVLVVVPGDQPGESDGTEVKEDR